MLPFRMVDATYPRPLVHHRKLRPTGDDSASARHAYPIPAGNQVGPNSALGSPCPSAPENSNNSLTPFTATDPKKHVLSPIIATLPKTPFRKPFICHTSETPPWYLLRNYHPQHATSRQLSPLFSYSCALFCHAQNAISFVFKPLHTLCKKPPGVGGGYSQRFNVQPSNVSTFSPARPIAAERPWCNNERRRENSSRPGETTPLSPVSKNTRADIGNRSLAFPVTPRSAGVASRAWVQRSNTGFRVCTYKP
jgi:hypothetical protein